nr:MAG TPA: hypothetical protein [Bacteriophage sp.]
MFQRLNQKVRMTRGNLIKNQKQRLHTMGNLLHYNKLRFLHNCSHICHQTKNIIMNGVLVKTIL